MHDLNLLVTKTNENRLSSIMGSGIALNQNDIKDIIKVLRSLKTRETLSKGNTKKLPLRKGDFSIFFRPLVTAGVQLMRNVFTLLAKNVLVPLRLKAAPSATAAAV